MGAVERSGNGEDSFTDGGFLGGSGTGLGYLGTAFGWFAGVAPAVTPPGLRGATEGFAAYLASSVAAKLGSPNTYVDYAASKGAIDSFTIGLGHEVAGEGRATG